MQLSILIVFIQALSILAAPVMTPVPASEVVGQPLSESRLQRRQPGKIAKKIKKGLRKAFLPILIIDRKKNKKNEKNEKNKKN
jgi:hypothetical protein